MIRTVPRGLVRYAELRSGEQWLDAPIASIVGLERTPLGALELLREPAVLLPAISTPGLSLSSGLALDSQCGLYIADTDGNRIVRVALDCGAEMSVPGVVPAPVAFPQLNRPRGMAVGPHQWLYVADSGNGRVVMFTTPELGLRGSWADHLSHPVAVAADAELAVLVLDSDRQRVFRYDPSGRLDSGFDAAFALPTGSGMPLAIACGADGSLYLACAGLDGIFVYDRSGRRLPPIVAAGVAPQSLAVENGILYAADSHTGRVLRFSAADGHSMGSVAGFQGPVSALVADGDGHVYIKTGLDAAYHRAYPGLARIDRGTVTAGPLDAGRDAGWYRTSVSADVPPRTEVLLETFQSDNKNDTPSWTASATTDELLCPMRYLWLRVTLVTHDGQATPRLEQVEAETPGDSYLDLLPAVYSRDQTTVSLLEHLLDLAKSLLGDLEREIADLPALFDTTTTRVNALSWLASWQAFTIPSSLSAGSNSDAVRALLARLPELYQRRGTPHGVRDFVEIYTGARPHIFEGFRERAAWVLGVSSQLGIDTGLPLNSVDGLVPDQSVVGATSIESDADWGSALFRETAHRFSVLVPAAEAPTAKEQQQIRAVIDLEKPAHTDYHLCIVMPTFRVGVQCRLDVDAIVAGQPEPAVLAQRGALNADARLADRRTDSAEVGLGHVGVDMRIG